jgi:hypothetical protein
MMLPEETRLEGTMLWYSLKRDEGVVQCEDGVRLTVNGDGFTDGIRPEPRCAGTPVTFRRNEDAAHDVVVTPIANQRRARARRGGFR